MQALAKWLQIIANSVLIIFKLFVYAHIVVVPFIGNKQFLVFNDWHFPIFPVSSYEDLAALIVIVAIPQFVVRFRR